MFLWSFIDGIQGRDCFLRTGRDSCRCKISACIIFYI